MFGRNRGKFDTLAHEWPARRLGAHPPGSTRVMAHGGNVPREKAIRLDPERETGIAIAMRPVMTRPAAAACPMPRERMIHYFNGAVRPGREEAA
ncbi:MAG: hypothetical protein LBQ62_02475 [Candidatus Accumulibacter sp.]|nr:hypothetical protein [Accumulibacter sp.]